jgi:hypothetical protein
MARYKTGKKPPLWHPKTLLMSKYTQKNGSPLPPAEKVYTEYLIPPATIGMFLNDQLSCCLAAYACHHLMNITAHTGKMIVPTNDDCQKFYSAFSGYVPGDPSTDNGGYFTDMYDEWQTNGLCGVKISGWVQIDTKDLAKRMQAIRLFLGCGVGVLLPPSAESQFEANHAWTMAPGDVPTDGHAVLESGEGADGHNFGSWGFGAVKADNNWDMNCADEVYVPLTPLLISRANDLAPASLDWDTLVADLAALKA